MDSCILSGDMKIFVHHIYELQKGIRERYNHRKTLIQSA